MAKPTRNEIEKLTPSERVELELKLAAEYGRSPRRQIMLDSHFSSQRSTPAQFSPGSTLLPTVAEARMNDLDVQRTVTEIAPVPDSIRPLILRGSPQALYESINTHLDHITSDNRYQVLELISDQLLALQLQSNGNEVEAVQTLQRRIAKVVFGVDEFEDLPRQSGGASPPKV